MFKMSNLHKAVFLLTFGLAYSKPLQPVSLLPANILPAEPAIGIAHVPAHVGTAISKTVHYAETPLITGYTSTLYKPDLSAFGGLQQYNYQRTLLRPVKTLIPKIVHVEPDIVHVPVIPSIKDIEIAAPVIPKVPAIEHNLINFPSIIDN